MSHGFLIVEANYGKVTWLRIAESLVKSKALNYLICYKIYFGFVLPLDY